MIAQVVITNAAGAIDSIANGVHYYLPQVNVMDITVTLLAVSKFAQLAYKHWTTDGTKVDKLAKLVGAVQDTPPTTTIVLPKTEGTK